MGQLWNIDELTDLAQAALRASAYDGQRSGQVRDFPDKRTIRYYTTLGLIDRPAEIRGRTAFYGRRHVLQLVAIKRLQARRLSLGEIQRALIGVDNDVLARHANLLSDFWESVARSGPSNGDTPETPAPNGLTDSTDATEENGRSEFWKSEPVELKEVASPADDAPPQCLGCSAVHLRLSPGVTLVIEGIQMERFEQEALSKLKPAVRDLLRAMRGLGITPHETRGGTQKGGENANHPNH